MFNKNINYSKNIKYIYIFIIYLILDNVIREGQKRRRRRRSPDDKNSTAQSGN